VRPKPVITSSATNRMSSSRQASRMALSQPTGGTITPPEPWIGSQKKAATFSAPSVGHLGAQRGHRRRDQRLRVAALRLR
jgi:hypothetical protein